LLKRVYIDLPTGTITCKSRPFVHVDEMSASSHRNVLAMSALVGRCPDVRM